MRTTVNINHITLRRQREPNKNHKTLRRQREPSKKPQNTKETMGTNTKETIGTSNTISKVYGTVPKDLRNRILMRKKLNQHHDLGRYRYRICGTGTVPVKPAEPSGHVRLPVLAGEVG
jgi:hypothetical protein